MLAHPPEEIASDEQEKPAEGQRNDDGVEEIDPVDQWVVFQRGAEMARPGVWEVLIGAWVALLAGGKQIGFDDR